MHAFGDVRSIAPQYCVVFRTSSAELIRSQPVKNGCSGKQNHRLLLLPERLAGRSIPHIPYTRASHTQPPRGWQCKLLVDFSVVKHDWLSRARGSLKKRRKSAYYKSHAVAIGHGWIGLVRIVIHPTGSCFSNIRHTNIKLYICFIVTNYIRVAASINPDCIICAYYMFLFSVHNWNAHNLISKR